jgi:hypothetical protein
MAAIMSWGTLTSEAPELAAAGRRLLGGDASTVAYLATVRKDGGPRVHPVMPVLTASGLYVFVVNLSWKYRDLRRDGRYAMHSAAGESGEEFYVTGPAKQQLDLDLRQEVRAASGWRLGGHDFEALFELEIERALHTEWKDWGTADTWPSYAKWAPSQGGSATG